MTAETGSPLVQSAINFSEGRRPQVIAAIVSALDGVQGVHVVDFSADPDHNRMVATILGDPDAVSRAVLAAAEAAVSLIDLRSHTGAHPRIGAMDVVPLVPVRNVNTEALVRQSLVLARDLASRFELPVYLYEQSARPGRPSALPQIRGGGFEARLGVPLTGALAPDFGPGQLHPTAGAVVVGVRGPLVAYNVLLAEAGGAAARQIARAIRVERTSAPELAGVRALGMDLPSRGMSQVSMNVTRPDATPLPPIFRYVCRRADDWGAHVVGSEVIGLIPAASLGGEHPHRIGWHDFRPTQILEYWMERIP